MANAGTMSYNDPFSTITFNRNATISSIGVATLPSSNVRIHVRSGGDAAGIGGVPAFGIEKSDGGYSHFITSRHTGVTANTGNAIDIFLNDSVASDGSSAPGVGNTHGLSITANGVGVGISTPTVALDVSGQVRASSISTLMFVAQTISTSAIRFFDTNVAAGNNVQVIPGGIHSVAFGTEAGYDRQHDYGIAIGYQAASTIQATNAIAIGNNAGRENMAQCAVAIGLEAGFSSLGANAIAIGPYANRENGAANSIVLNASSGTVNAGVSGFFVNPIRSRASGVAGMVSKTLWFDTTTNEICYQP